MRFLLLAILLGFPLAEAALLVTIGQGHALWVVAWLVLSALMGVVLIKQARFELLARLTASFTQGRFSLAALIDSGKTVLAGLLLIFPGVISDMMALVLLLIPTRSPEFEFQTAPASRFGVIEGEYRRER
jgi:UPF0716 protein FxsA